MKQWLIIFSEEYSDPVMQCRAIHSVGGRIHHFLFNINGAVIQGDKEVVSELEKFSWIHFVIEDFMDESVYQKEHKDGV